MRRLLGYVRRGKSWVRIGGIVEQVRLRITTTAGNATGQDAATRTEGRVESDAGHVGETGSTVGGVGSIRSGARHPNRIEASDD